MSSSLSSSENSEPRRSCQRSFKDENEGDAVDSKANNNGTANAVDAKVINGHAEQETIYQMMLPYLQLQITAKFETFEK
ncbi:hypothetical protein MAM1_0007c00852 [Mucor ambiguus]|uniref:Uncharacterized protein n=1 Tax=Mucor ambiguus TaxID=91626 RepID=A0A0C9M4Y4_9FUNG|nr:hypothetical protein MAM1_0007c00852 [Mucor ambiguus]